MSNKFAFPRFDNYYGDYFQLAFSFEKKESYAGLYRYEEDPLGKVYSQFMVMNLSKFSKNVTKEWHNFIKIFNIIWLHEFLHLVGLSEKGLRIVKELGFPCYL